MAHGLVGYVAFRLPAQPIPHDTYIDVLPLPNAPRAPEPLVTKLPAMAPVLAPLISPPPELDLPAPVSSVTAVTASTAPVVSRTEPTIASIPQTAGPDTPNDWQAQLATWIREHKTYPRLAQQRGQQGAVTVEFEVLRSGHVSRVRMLRGSGVAALDAAALALLVDASVPPFTAAMQQQSMLITMVLDYHLQRR